MKPCPFCRGEGVVSPIWQDKTLAGYIVFCQSCYSQSGVKDTEVDAKKLWDSRPRKAKYDT